MDFPASRYLEQRNGGLYVAGTRVSLDSVVISFREAQSPERIAEEFPTLPLSQVYGAIAYYLENPELIEKYLAEGQCELERAVPPLSRSAPELHARLMTAREKLSSPQP